MNCPDCGHTLSPTRIETGAPGGTIEIDRCPFCGGVWFDHFEVNRLPTHEAIRLSNLAPEGELTKLVGSGQCPHCGIRLHPFSGQQIPKETHILTCPHCRGNWISRKELAKVKQEQTARLSRFKTFGIPLSSIYAVFLPLLLIIFLATATAFTVGNLRSQSATRIRARELIGAPSVIPTVTGEFSRTVVITFSSSKPVTSGITLTGPNITSPRQLTLSTTPKLEHTIWLTGLLPKTTYQYKITVIDEQAEQTEAKFDFTTP